MIIVKTPFRVSFFGGGTDLKSFYSLEDGCVISSTIDKYVYILVKRQKGIIEKKYKINWKINEYIDNIEDIKHPIIRETLKYFNIKYPVEIASFADIPASTGLGSSSAFAVGLVHALLLLEKKPISKKKIANIAATIEIDILKRSIGKQDHYASSYGGFNSYTFKNNENVIVKSLKINKKVFSMLENNLIMLYTGIKRDAHKVLKRQHNTKNIKAYRDLKKLKKFCLNFLNLYNKKNFFFSFGKNLDDYWSIKKNISKGISNNIIDKYYKIAKNNGATGGKILGAGGGGFLLFYASKKKHKKIILSLKKLKKLDFKFSHTGTEVIYNKDM